MTSDILRRAIGGIDAELIENADKAAVKPRRAAWMKWAAAAAAVVIIAVGAFAIAHFGGGREQQTAILPALTPNPNEGVTIFAVEEPAEKCEIEQAMRMDMSAEKMMSGAKKVFRGRVESIQEFELKMLYDGNPVRTEYRSRAVLTVTDPIYGDIEKDEVVSMMYRVTSHIAPADAIILEEGKEYILILNTYDESAVMDSFDYKSVSENYLRSSAKAAMPIDDEGLVNYIPIFGDLDGKALHDGEIERVEGPVHAYRANYEDIKARLLELAPIKGQE